MMQRIKEYNHNNQTLMFDTATDTYHLFSYSTQVLVISKGVIELNLHGKISTTTSKHITQALSFLGIQD